MGYRMMKLPLWAVGVYSGVTWAVVMLLGQAALSDGLRYASVLVILVIAALFGAAMAVTVRRQRRLLFTVDGRMRSGPERLAVVRAVDLGEPISDDLRDVARRYAERMLPRTRWWPVAVVSGALGVLSAWLAVTGSPGWWLGVAAYVVFGLTLVRHLRRQRARVERYLAAESVDGAHERRSVTT
jgi:TRAP-type C4-dicarboxylate transport system permease small subunit